MDASLDTNVIIHLYKANLQSVLFNRFHGLKVYEFIRSHEMQNHAEAEILELFDEDVEAGRIELITNEYFKSIGMNNVFMQHVKDFRILFDSGDLGEVYAISMAKTLGCICLVTDDVKERGPHYTLMRIPDSDVIPLAFYEIFLLDYLEERITEEELLDRFDTVCHLSGLAMDFKSKLRIFIKRFWSDPYNVSEKEWMKDFCKEKNIIAKERIQAILSYINRGQGGI